MCSNGSGGARSDANKEDNPTQGPPTLAAGFPRTAEMLDREGYEVIEIDNTDCAKLDGGMSCLSLRF